MHVRKIQSIPGCMDKLCIFITLLVKGNKMRYVYKFLDITVLLWKPSEII
jgi:hypothetical protein